MLQTLRKVGFAEGLSFLILLGIAMPLKYLYGQPLAVRIVGMAHGLLFIAFVTLAYQVASSERWPNKQMAFALLASVLPFGTFIFDRCYLAAKPKQS